MYALRDSLFMSYAWLIYVACTKLIPVGSAENEESSSDVQAEEGKPSGMYCYLYYSVWVCQRHRSATSCISDNLSSVDFIYWDFFSSIHLSIPCFIQLVCGNS